MASYHRVIRAGVMSRGIVLVLKSSRPAGPGSTGPGESACMPCVCVCVCMCVITATGC